MATIVSKATIIDYLGTDDQDIINKFSNIIESLFHKAEGVIVKSIIETEDKVMITFSDETTKTFYNSDFIDSILVAINANPVDGWVFVKTKADMQSLTGETTKGYYILKDDIDNANNGSWGFDGSVFYQGYKLPVIEEQGIVPFSQNAAKSGDVYSHFSEKINNLYTTGDNLANPDDIVPDEYVHSSGVYVPSENWWRLRQPVKPSTRYRSNLSMRDRVLITNDGSIISSHSDSVDDITTPANCVYIDFSGYNSDYTKFMLVEGDSVPVFEPYRRLYKHYLGKLNPQLPSIINLLKGETVQFYYSSMIAFPNWRQFYFAAKVDGVSVGNARDLVRYLELNSSVNGERTMTVNIYNYLYELIGSASTVLSIRTTSVQPSARVDFWMIGDSNTNNPTTFNEMVRRLTGTGGTPTAFGYGNIYGHREGNSGKEWNWYVTNEDSPFVYNGVLDFEQYRVDNGLEVPDVVYLPLTWNGMGSNRTQEEWDTWDDDVYTFIDALRSDFSSVKVRLCSPHFPSQNGGLGIGVYADFDSNSNVFLQNKNCLKQAEIYERISKESSYFTWVTHIQNSLMVDSVNNMQQSLKDVNTRNSTVQEYVGTDGPHPEDSGHLQTADIYVRDFARNYCV